MPHSSTILTAVHHTRNYLVFFRLSTVFARTWFLMLNEYNDAPSSEEQNTWIPLPFMGGALILTIVVGCINAKKRTDNHHFGAEEYAGLALSPPFAYFIWRLVSGTDAMPVAWFATLTISSWMLSVPLLWKMASVSFNEKPILSFDEVRAYQFQSRQNSDVSLGERGLNFLRVGKATVLTTATVMAAMRRESAGRTQELSLYEYQVLAAIFFGAIALVGREATRNPGIAFAYYALLKGFEHFALIMEGLNGLFFTLAVYLACSGGEYCIKNTAIETTLSEAGAFFALGFAVYSAATTYVHPERVELSNKFILRKMGETGDKIAGCFGVIGSGLYRLRNCCGKKKDLIPSEEQQLLSTIEGGGASNKIAA